MNARFGYVLVPVLLLVTQSWALADTGRSVTITSIQGQVQVRQNNSDWKPAETGMVLYASDEIRTGEQSTAKLLIDENNRTGELDMHPTSRMRLNTLELNQETGEKTTVLDLAIGKVLIHAEKLKGDSVFNVRTPNSTTGVRGTTFTVSAQPNQ